jgi:hypothetical protein
LRFRRCRSVGLAPPIACERRFAAGPELAGIQPHGQVGRRRQQPATGLGALRRRHADLGVTSVYLRGIDNTEIIDTVHERRAPMMSASAGLRILR